MKDIIFIYVGNIREKYFYQALDEYKKRLSAYCRVTEYEIKEEKTPDNPNQKQIQEALNKESEKIIAKIPKNALVISLCIEGKQYDSSELSQILIQTDGAVVFIIGSSHGLSENIKEKSRIKLSMSKLTFPHRLARIMLYEQVYRGFTILAGKDYHK